ncbi:MAG: GIY-YIG nuclease family protein [Christensenellaceae bacterium]|nr:GIY-YIG nuclease family protein [Christensenellaceae bacterium]
MDIIIGIIIGAAVILTLLFIQQAKKNNQKKTFDQLNKKLEEDDRERIETLLKFVEIQKQEEEEKRRMLSLKKAEQKEKLEVFKRTKDELKERLKEQFDRKEWVPLEKILKGADKGGMGIYLLFNETKKKYYVGQAKAVYSRIKKHFDVEDIAADFMNGDKIAVKILNAAEIDSDYRIDHIEKTGIELFSGKDGYNKTNGNLH